MKKKMLRLRRVWCQWCQWHCKAWLGGVNDTAESDSSVFFINRGISITFYFINGLKIAWKPWPLHTNELWVQMSKYQEDTLAKLFWNCLFKLEKKNFENLHWAWLSGVNDTTEIFAHVKCLGDIKKNKNIVENLGPRWVRIMKKWRSKISWHYEKDKCGINCPIRLYYFRWSFKTISFSTVSTV